jgi:hypothetical protein
MISGALLSVDRRRTADVQIVVPVSDEEAGLEESIRRLHGYLSTRFPCRGSSSSSPRWPATSSPWVCAPW